MLIKVLTGKQNGGLSIRVRASSESIGMTSDLPRRAVGNGSREVKIAYCSASIAIVLQEEERKRTKRKLERREVS